MFFIDGCCIPEAQENYTQQIEFPSVQYKSNIFSTFQMFGQEDF